MKPLRILRSPRASSSEAGRASRRENATGQKLGGALLTGAALLLSPAAAQEALHDTLSGIAPRGAEGALVARLEHCARISEAGRRLACFDALALDRVEPAFEGRLGSRTESFEVTAPMLLRFESDDVIMVVYLLDEAGEVFQNLHRAGRGLGEYEIRRPGTYSLQVNASGSWRAWLTPLADAEEHDEDESSEADQGEGLRDVSAP
ncbi:hypothetical protein [Neomegalonema perideroedes]|uniref:hypothetical protein n=1 Tax=Neomegalonema perideroedes TaxID=217219 RepID=UPI00037D7ACC|nr:hypothetical protein [Neomegalonema perideroedes]